MSVEFSFETEILNNHAKWLSMAKFYYPKDIQSAEDLVSEVVEKILNNKDKFEIGTNFSAWGYNILRNTFINHYRQQKHRLDDFELDSDRCTNLVSVDADVDVRESDILAYIDKLPDDIKYAFNQHLLGFKYEEIADGLDLPIGTIKSRIFKARHMLQEQLTNEFNKSKTIIQSTEIMPTTVDKTENLKSLFKYLFEFCDNEWKTVQENPLTPIYIQHGLDHNWGAAIMQTLCNCNEFVITGDKSGVKYRSKTDIRPNYIKLATDTIKNKQDQKESSKERKEYIKSVANSEPRKYVRKSDTVNSELNYSKPVIVPKESPINPDAKLIKIEPEIKIAQVVEDTKSEHMEMVKNLLFPTKSDISDPRTHFNPEDICFMVHNGEIIEMEIVGIYKKGNLWLHNLYNSVYNIDIHDMLVSDLYDTPEALCMNLLKNYKTKK